MADKIYQRKEGIMDAKLNDETVMMDITTGKYYNLGEVGGSIWRILERPMTLSALVECLTAEYDVSPEQCEKDVVPFLKQLQESGLMKETEL